MCVEAVRLHIVSQRTANDSNLSWRFLHRVVFDRSGSANRALNLVGAKQHCTRSLRSGVNDLKRKGSQNGDRN